MVIILNRVPGTRIFINGNIAGRPWEQRACFCHYDGTGTAGSSLTFEQAQAQAGSFAFVPANRSAPFPTLEKSMARAVQPRGKYLLWTDEGWAGWRDVLVMANGQTLDPIKLWFWDFSALAGTSGAGKLGWHCPAGSIVSMAGSNLVLTGTGMAMLTRIDDVIDRSLPVESNTVWLALDDSARCGTISGSLTAEHSAEWITLLTPQVSYRWEPDFLGAVKSARLLSDQPTDHNDVVARFEFHRFDPSEAASLIALGTASQSGRLLSCINDTTGRNLHLEPVDGAAIHFETNSEYTAYASLKGKFRIGTDSAPQPASASVAACEVMPGSAGTEFFQLFEGDYDGLEFFPGQKAFVEFGTETSDPKLTLRSTTAWVAPCRTGAVQAWATTGFGYVSQPQEHPLYGRRNTGSLTPLQQPTAATVLFDPTPRHVTGSMPFFPFRGVSADDLDQTRELDVNALAHERANIAAQSVVAQGAAPMAFGEAVPSATITTPHGLLVDVDDRNQWHRIVLGEGGGNWSLSIPRPAGAQRWALQEALSRPDPFVVIGAQRAPSLPGPAEPAFDTIELKVNIAGWPMTVTVADAMPPPVPLPPSPTPATSPSPAPKPPRGFEPVLVIKLAKGSLKDLLKSAGLWTLAHVFNNDPAHVSSEAVDALDHLERLKEGESPFPCPQDQKPISEELKPHYRALYEKVTNPEWTGVLIFNANTPLKGVPGPVSVITQDETATTFNVPVLGIDINRVVPSGSQMKLERTSAFGAIHYHLPEPLKPTDPGFAFKVRGVNAVFDNTELRTFLASMQLRVGEFFGEKSKEKQPAGTDKSRILDIVGRYEARAGADGQYIFRALARRTFDFNDGALVSSLTVTRIDVTSARMDDGVVESRFAMWGELAFGKAFSGVTGVSKIGFGNAALILHGSHFSADAGDVSVEFDRNSASDAQGLLAKFPFQLSGLRWSPKLQSLVGAGFTGLHLPGLPGFDGGKFEFGLELDLNLGSMGKLFEAAEFLKARILVGWFAVEQGGTTQREFSIGFHFVGGSGPLDIGINGVMRLTAEQVSLKTYDHPAGIGIGLLKPQLEVMGYKVPSEPKDTLVAFLPAGQDNVAWAWARTKTSVGPLELDYFAIGQRIALVPSGAFGPGASLKSVIDASAKQMQPSQDSSGTATLPDIGKLYTPEAGWGVVARGNVSSFAFRFVFMDGIDRYGLGVDIPAVANVDVLYRKLGDGLGIFSAEIEPSFRTLEFGPVTVTLPIINFDALTNGGWSINIGYHGNDFSRGTTVQVLPLIGSGGVRFGRLDWRSSYVLNSPESTRRELVRQLQLDPVIEMSFAARVGLGKEFREGVFFAGITLSVYGIFEGAIGTPRDPRFDSTGCERRYLRIYGAAGVLLEIFGAVNFAIVSAAVSIRVWVETGITFETWAPVLIHAEAGVAVYVHFVIARFSVFGHTIEIAIDFSFSTQVRITQQIAESFDGSLPNIYKPYVGQSVMPLKLLPMDEHEAISPLLWELHKVAIVPAQQSCAVTIEPMMSDGKPVVLPMLVASGGDSPGIATFAIYLYTWALRLSLGLGTADPLPASVGLADLRALTQRLAPNKGTPLSRWGSVPLDFVRLHAFMEDHLRLVLRKVVDLRAEQGTERASGTLLPWFADLALFVEADGKNETVLRDFRGADATMVDDVWEKSLFEALARSRPEFEADAPQQVKMALAAAGVITFQAGSKNALDAVVEDWAAALVQGMAHRAVQAGEALCKDKPEKESHVVLADLFATLSASGPEGSPAAQVAQHASSFLHHGLRVPPADGSPGSRALPQWLGTELSIEMMVANGKIWQLTARAGAGFVGQWLAGASPVEAFDARKAAAQMNALQAKLVAQKIRVEARFEDDLASTTRPRRFTALAGVACKPSDAQAADLRLTRIPRSLLSVLQRKGPQAVITTLYDPENKELPKPGPQRWFTCIELRLGSPRTGTGNAYPLLNADQRIRELVNAMMVSNVALVGAWLTYSADGTAPPVPLLRVDGDGAFVLVSNFSSEPAPETLTPLAATESEPPTHASMAAPERLAQVLWMASTVNAPGFELTFAHGNPIAHLFGDATVATVQIVFELTTGATLHPVVDGVLVDEVDSKRTLVIETTGIPELITATPDGQVAIEVSRRNPWFGAVAAADAQDFAAFCARYDLADYIMKDGSLARADVVPLRVSLDEEQRHAALNAEPEWWTHRLLVPLTQIAGMSPYAHVGKDLKDLILPGLRDGGGHYLADAAIDFEWIGNTRVLYRDTIPQLQEIPGVSASWTLDRTGGTPHATIQLQWSASQLFGNDAMRGSRRAALLRQFQRWEAMFTTSDFTAHADVSIGAYKEVSVDVRQGVADWLGAIRKQIEDASDRDCAPAPIVLPISPAMLQAATPRPLALEVTLTFKRDDTLCDKRIGNSDVWLACSAVSPAQLQTAANWAAWASNVQEVFAGAFTLLRRQRSQAASQGERTEVPTPYLMRASMLQPGSPRAMQAAFYAPTPLAKTLRSGTATVQMSDGQSRQADIADMDMNAVASRAADAIESLLDPRASAPLCKDFPAQFTRVALSKRAIGAGMAARLASVIDRGPNVGAQARRKFTNAARADVRTAFAPVIAAEVQLSPPTVAEPIVFLWGRVSVGRQQDVSAGLSFSPVRIPLGARGIEGTFDFVAGWAVPGNEPVAALEGRMSVHPKFVEVKGEKEISGYRPSEWYELPGKDVQGGAAEFSIASTAGPDWAIPLPLRLIPPTPAILRHGFEPGGTRGALDLEDHVRRARAWSYTLALMLPGTNHDTTEVAVRFDDSPSLSPFSADQLFSALAAFSYHERLVAAVTAQLISGTHPDAKDVGLVATLFESIGSALAVVPLAPESTELIGHTRTVTLGKRTEEKQTTLYWTVTPSEYQATVAAALLDMTATNASEASEPIVPDAFDPQSGTATYKHRPPVDTAIAGIAGLSPRQVQLSSLDVMVHGSASPRVMSRRNAQLAGIVISPAFVFETPAVETPDPLVPHLLHTEPYDMFTGVGVARPLASWLGSLKAALASGVNEAAFTIDVSARFCLPLASGSGTAIDYYVPLPSMKDVKLGDRADWASALAGYLQPALERLQPGSRARGSLHLEVQVFHAASHGAKRPALSLHNLRLPLTKVALQQALPQAAPAGTAAATADLPVWGIAACVHAHTRGFTGNAAQMHLARVAWARFAIASGEAVIGGCPPPRLAEIDRPMAATEWALCTKAAMQAITDMGNTDYALVDWAPSASEAVWPMRAFAAQAVQLAGPLQRVGDEMAVFLWGVPR